MAVWGVPDEGPDDVQNAVFACLAMREQLRLLNERRCKRGDRPLYIGMGLNFGEVTAGGVGATERMEYTVVGDAVNLASRIEGMTKQFGVDLLVERSVFQAVEADFCMNSCGKVSVKGKEEAVELFRVRGYYDLRNNPVILETPYSSLAAKEESPERLLQAG